MSFLKYYKFIKKNQKNRVNKLFLKGFFALKIITTYLITLKNFENIKRFLVKKLKKYCSLCFRIKSNLLFTKKSLGARMGQGFGKLYSYKYLIRAGTLFMECFSYNNKLIQIILQQVLRKSYLKSVFCNRKYFYKRIQ